MLGQLNWLPTPYPAPLSQPTPERPMASCLLPAQPAAPKIVSDVSCLELLLLLVWTPKSLPAPCSPCQAAFWMPQLIYSIPPPHTRVTELVQRVPESGLLVLELSCEGEEDETAFPPLHYEL